MDYPPEAGSRFRLFAPPAIVSWISQAVTLTPGDVIYTGTPGRTGKMKPRGDPPGLKQEALPVQDVFVEKD